MPFLPNLYDAPASMIDYELVRQFVLQAEAADLLAESVTLEFKAKRSGTNVAEAVAALSNTDGGLVLVGVAEKGSEGEGRLVGLPRTEHDSIVSHLHSLIPTAMPEVIPVRIPGSDRIIVVLRVNADLVPHPVLVAGKVVFRVPGATVPADRQRVIDLVDRDRKSSHEIPPPSHPLQGASTHPLWPEDQRSVATLRVIGGLVLPHRVLDRPWLDTTASGAALTALRASPLPARCWGPPPTQVASPEWRVTEARSKWLRVIAEETSTVLGTEQVPADAAAFLNLAERSLSMIVGLRWFPAGATVAPVPLQSLHSALLAALVTVSTTCDAMAAALGAAEPSEPAVWEGWLQPREHRVPHVLAIDQFPRDSTDYPTGGWFPPSKSTSRDVEGLDVLVRNWITVLLLDMGVRGFEAPLNDLPLPEWTSNVIA